MKIHQILLIGLFTGGCANVSPVNISSPELLKDKITRASLAFTVDGIAFSGTATVSRKPMHNFVFTLPANTIKLMITTCAREDVFINPEWKRPFHYQYLPSPDVESTASCFLTATTISDKGVTNVGFTDFRGLEGLHATVGCNGRVGFPIGVLFCQSREGLTQSISFAEPVAAVAQDSCPKLIPGNKENSFELKLGKHLCVYKFQNKSKDVFRLTTFGYSMINEVILGQ